MTDPASAMVFVGAAYAAAAIVVGGLVLWVFADSRIQTRRLAELEAMGLVRGREDGGQ